MIYKKYEFPSYNIYTIKTDKFKSCHMEIIYRDKVDKNDILERSMICDIISACSKKYPKKKDVVIKKEELYRTSFYGVNTRVGNTTATNFILNFINPKYALESDFLEEVLKFPFDMIEHPNVVDDEFDNRIFNIIKNGFKDSIQNIKENPNKLAIRGALNAMDANTPTSYGLLNSEDHLDDITPATLYKSYKRMLKTCLCDIFIIGNLDMDKVVKIIDKNFKNRAIKSYDVDLYVENKERKKPIEAEKESHFVQSNFIKVYNINDFTKRERDFVFPIFNHIFGTGSLNSKLYKNLREENSLCYNVKSMYMKYDKLLMIKVSLAYENIKKADELINKSLKEMQSGKFMDSDLEDAKTSLIFNTNAALDSPSSILDNYVFNIYDNIVLLEDRKKEIKSVTKEEVIALGKKIKLNTIFTLKEGDN